MKSDKTWRDLEDMKAWHGMAWHGMATAMATAMNMDPTRRHEKQNAYTQIRRPYMRVGI